MNQKIVAVFLIFVIISITPASAVEYSDIQNDIESIKYSQQHFGFWQCFKVMGKVFKLMKHVCQIDVYQKISESKGAREELKTVKNNRLLQRTALLKYLSDKDKIENSNQVNPLNTKNSVNNIKQINKVKPNVKVLNSINGTENSTKNSNQINDTQNSTKGSNQIQSIENNTQINNTGKVKAETVEAPEQAVKHANDIKSKLDEKGLHVKINNTHGSIEGLKLNDIVQLIETHGYIRYWIFKGINSNVTDNKVVSLYNGKTDVNVSLTVFKRSFTGIVMNLDGDYKVKMVTTWWGQRIKMYMQSKDTKTENNVQPNKSSFAFLSALFRFSANRVGSANTETVNVTEYDVVDEIYQIQKKTLEDSISNSGRNKVKAGLFKSIGIGLSILAPIVGGIGAAFAAMPEPLISKFAAFVLAIIAIIVMVLSLASFFFGLGWETDILFKESIEKNELTNLESREL